MANPTVEKLKAAGLRHGEKAVVGLVALACLFLFYLAWSRPTITIRPDEVTNAATAAKANINKQQKEEDILAKLEAEGIKEANFEKVVEANKPGTADPTKYRLAQQLTYLAPGAGLIRDQPALVTVQNLVAHAGRGSVEMFEVDENGERILIDPAEAEKAAPKGKASRKGAGSMAMGMEGMFPGTSKKGSAKADDEAARAEAKAKRERDRMLAGQAKNRPKKADEKVEEEPQEERTVENQKRSDRGLRWVALTGAVDHKGLRENYAKALKTEVALAHPRYVRVDLQRQQRRDDGSWSDWEDVDRKYNEEAVLGNVVEQEPNEDEFVSTDARLPGLVDTLPFLKVGFWAGVYHPDVVRDEILNPKKPDRPAGGMMGGGMPGMGPMSGMGMDRGRGSMMAGGGMPEGMGAMSGGMSGMMGGGMSGGGDTSDPNYPKSEAEQVMVRSLDFTVEPDQTYRYHARIVVRNPNWGLENVTPGADNDSKELAGDWSEPSGPVAVPADVATYLVRKLAAPNNAPDPLARRDDQVEFQVVRWKPDDGQIIVKRFTEAPGKVVGDNSSAAVADFSKDNPRQKSDLVDFTSHQILADATGATKLEPANGSVSLAAFKLGNGSVDLPAQALLVRPDGVLVLRDQAADAANGEMKEMADIYKQTLDEVKGESKRESSIMGGMSGMMDGYMSGNRGGRGGGAQSRAGSR